MDLSFQDTGNILCAVSLPVITAHVNGTD